MNGRKFFQTLLDSRNLNPHSLAKNLKKPTLQSTLQRYLDGKTAEVRRSTFEPIADFFGISVDGFYSPEVAVHELSRIGLQKIESRIIRRANTESVGAGVVPVVSWVQAGDWSGMADGFEPADGIDWIPCPIRHSSHTYALIVRGVSMYNPAGKPSFQDGDTIFIDPDRQADHRSLVIARLDDEKEATFKQLLIEGEQRMLQALNPSWPNRIITINGNCSICGVVIGKLESFI